MTPDTLPEFDFFSAAAVIAGALWAITTALFPFITGGIVRSGLLSRVGIDLVLFVSSVFIITISTLFLGGMLVALSMLMPPGPRAHVQDIFEWLPLPLLVGTVVVVAVLSRSKARERLGKAQMVLIAVCIACWLLIAAVGTGSTCIAHAQTPDLKGHFCRAVGLGDARPDLIVVFTIAAGCLLSLFLGIVSMQTELIASISGGAPKPPDRDSDAQHLADTQSNDRGDAERTSMSRKLIAKLTLGPTEKERFLSHWNLVDRIFKLVQWLVTIGVIAALAKKMRGTFDAWVLIVIAVVLFLAITSSLVALGDAFEPRLSEVDHKVYRVLARVGAIAFVGVCLLAFSQALLAILTAETH